MDTADTLSVSRFCIAYVMAAPLGPERDAAVKVADAMTFIVQGYIAADGGYRCGPSLDYGR